MDAVAFSQKVLSASMTSGSAHRASTRRRLRRQGRPARASAAEGPPEGPSKQEAGCVAHDRPNFFGLACRACAERDRHFQPDEGKVLEHGVGGDVKLLGVGADPHGGVGLREVLLDYWSGFFAPNRRGAPGSTASSAAPNCGSAAALPGPHRQPRLGRRFGCHR